MLTVSFQGTRLTPSERRRLEQQRCARAAFPAPSIAELVPLELVSSTRSVPDVVRPWSVDFVARGTPFVGDCFGF